MGWHALAAVVVVLSLLGCTPGARTGQLQGVTWQLVELRGGPADPAATVTALFEDGRVAGSAGCNQYSGSARLRGERISVGTIASTLMACLPESVMSQEAAYLQALETADRWQVEGDRLTLIDASGTVVLAYVRSTD